MVVKWKLPNQIGHKSHSLSHVKEAKFDIDVCVNTGYLNKA